VPSLNDLEKFRNSFRNIGNEAEDLASKGLTFADFPLPDAGGADTGYETTQQELNSVPDFDLDSLFGDASGQPVDDFDIDSIFTDTPITDPPKDDSTESVDELSTFDMGDSLETFTADDLPPADGPPGGSASAQGADISSIDDLESLDSFSLDALPDFDDPSGSSAPAQDADIPSIDDLESLDSFSLDALPDFADPSGGSASAQDADIPSRDDLESLDSFSLDALPDFADPSGGSAPVQGADIPSRDDLESQDNFSLDALPDFADPSGASASAQGVDIPSGDDETTDKAEVDPSDDGEDADDMSTVDAVRDTEENEPPPLYMESDDFGAVGFDDVLSNNISDKQGKTVSEKQKFVASDDIEEINLTEEEYKHLKNSLASFPLNLRIACEELIAEEAVAPNLMSRLIKLLIKEAPIQEVADLAGKIQGRIINIPKGFEKKSGAELEAERSSFSYLFIHKFLPIFWWTLFIGAVIASLFYLSYRFIWIPLYAGSIYKDGYERIGIGQYEDANTQFNQAFKLHPVKKWFSRYAEAFIAKRQYVHAEKKYEGLLKYYPREKQGALDYASLETNILQNYEKADSILRKYILDFDVKDKDALLAVGDNALLWGEIDPSKFETAREVYARYMEAYGQSPQILEHMLKYFIRTDNLKETLPLKSYFTDPATEKKRNISPETLTELGGYLFDKQFSETEGVPDEYISAITGTRDLLLDAVEKGPDIPEAHYNLSRYYHYFNNTSEEKSSLERALPLFDSMPETSKRLKKRIDAERRYAKVLVKNKEFFASEEHLQKGIRLYEDGLSRNLFTSSPDLASLYADMGDLAYFTKENDWDMALEYYRRAEKGGWKAPEMLYRMGVAFYHQNKWAEAQEKFADATAELPLNRRILNTMGSISFLRGDYFAAEGYYGRLLKTLNEDKARFPELSPQTRPDHYALAERLMVAQNNMGVVMEALTERTGNTSYKDRALSYYIDSQRAWDSLTRNPTTFIRAGITDLVVPGVNLAYLNSQNAFSPQPEFEPQIYVEIDKDVVEPSEWERLVPSTGGLTEPLN
jgi:tetratricopeptide (TPR) repeat protein